MTKKYDNCRNSWFKLLVLTHYLEQILHMKNIKATNTFDKEG